MSLLHPPAVETPLAGPAELTARVFGRRIGLQQQDSSSSARSQKGRGLDLQPS